MDFDDGMTVDEIFEQTRIAGKLQLKREKREIGDLVLSLASLFKKGIVQDHFRQIDLAIAKLEEKEDSREDKMKKSMKELNKLRAILGGG